MCQRLPSRLLLGNVEFKVLSFGLTKAPATFQASAVMNDIFRPYIQFGKSVYLDDILVFDQSAEGRAEHLRLVQLQLSREHQLYARGSKCLFKQSELEFLGHIVGCEGVKVDLKKTALVREWAVPLS